MSSAGDQAHLAGYRPSVATLVVATLTIGLLEMVLPITMLQVYDRVIPNHSEHTLTVLLICAAGLMLLDGILRYARGALMAYSGMVYSHRMARRAVEGIMAGDGREQSRRGPSENLSDLAAVKSMREFENGSTLVMMVEFLIIPAIIGLIAVIAGPLALVPATLFIGFVLASLHNGRRLGEAARARATTDDTRFNFMIEILRSIHSVKGLALEERATRTYERLKLDSSLANRGVSRALTRTFDTSTTFSSIMIFAILSIGAFMVLRGWISVGAMIASVLLSGRILQPLQRALALYARRKDIELDRQKARRVLGTPALRGALVAEPPENEGRLELRDVVARNPDESLLLDGASLSVAPGDVVSLVTRTAREQTAIMKLICGLWMPDEGTVLVNGCPTSSLSPEVLSRQVAYLQPEPTLYRGSIIDNLTRFGATSRSDALYIARLLDMEADIAALPSGLDTRLRGDSADPIPPGLRQRIALARQLAPRPRLILFDSADTGLDRQSYTAVCELLGRLRGRVGIVLASEDPRLQALATRTVRHEEGRFAEAPLVAPRNVSVTRYRELRI
ncbi:ABC transporter transmembrane domain-containing protein [Oceanicella sp. SM1341]|uniref:ABC transporter transmembrane domain-containing protein n=1 Tax=Oceanicella sp. SM1341 TaxID=1548889 RepID=UPI000E478430|nr:ABC transporter transmembrane domain-containing protein [Oceanicella sp. SM1341]